MRNPSRSPARRGRADLNQREIVEALEKHGCTVVSLSSVGAGVPDLLVGHKIGPHRYNVLMEVKQPGQKLRPSQDRFHHWWQGRIFIVHSIEEALNTVGITP